MNLSDTHLKYGNGRIPAETYLRVNDKRINICEALRDHLLSHALFSRYCFAIEKVGFTLDLDLLHVTVNGNAEVLRRESSVLSNISYFIFSTCRFHILFLDNNNDHSPAIFRNYTYSQVYVQPKK